MKRETYLLKPSNILIIALAFVLMQSCGSSSDEENYKDNMFQVATFDYFAAGQYDGVYPLAKVLERANFGIGTAAGLDGEMYAINGKVYQILSSGEVIETPNSTMVPFVMMCQFQPDTTFVYTEGGNVYDKIDAIVGDSTKLLAIKISGSYSSLTTRSVPKQNKPYKSVAQIVEEDQVVFYPSDKTGTAVGYRIPSQFGDVNPAGYHIHFISNNMQEGGHVLRFTTDSVTVSIHVLNDIELLWTQN